VPVSRPAGDTGGADPAVTAVLAAYAAGAAAEHAVLAAVAASRLLVPVVAVLAEADDGTVPPALASGHSAPFGSRSEKETEMALPTLIGNDGRKAVIAFTGTDTVKRWRQDARPVIEGARLRALADGAPPPFPHEDPDIRAQVTAVTADFILGPGGPDADLTITLKSKDLAGTRAAAEAIAARLAPRLRRGIAFRME
jgi:hypothetical protein